MIAVIGGEAPGADDAGRAFEAGRAIALRGHVLLCGGRGGVLEAACRGAREAGGHTIGLLPGENRNEANPYVEFALPTGLGHARNTVIATAADAVIALGGRFGTLSEIAFASIHGKPVVGLSDWQVRMPGGDLLPFRLCATAEEAVAACESAVAGKES